jgi:integrase
MARRHKTVPKYLTKEQALEALEVAKTFSKNLHLMFKVMITTGIRVSDYIALNKDNFKKTVNIGHILTFRARKNKQEIDAPITEEIYKNAMELDHLFPYSRWTAWNQIKQVGRIMGIKLTPHMLRHTYVVLSRQAGVSWELIAGITGDDFQTLKDWYHHVDPRELIAVREKFNDYMFK